MRNTKKALTTLTLIATASLALAACTNGATPDPEEDGAAEALTVSVLTPYLANATTKEVIDDFEVIAKDRGWSVNVVDTASDMSRLNSAFQDAAAQAPDAIVLGMGDPTQISLGLTAAADAGIPVFAIDAALADGIVVNVTSDNADLGTQSANALIEAIGGSGSVVMLTHDPHPGVKVRAEGARQAFADAGIEVIEEKHVNVPGPVEDARASIQDLIVSSGGEFTGIWGGWDEPALGAAQALDAAGVTDVTVVGVDGQDFAIAEIEKGGPFYATVQQDWDAIATKIADLIQSHVVDGEPIAEAEVLLPGKLVTKE